MKKGIVISDMHFFARRSKADSVEKELYSQLPENDILVCNGDMFDFRWRQVPSMQQAIDEAINWIKKTMDKFPSLEVKYVIGNHDCNRDFIDNLRLLEKDCPRFTIYEYYFQMGTSLFLHGDCSNSLLSFEDLKSYRAQWEKSNQWPLYLALGYQFFDVIGLTGFAHRKKFPRNEVVQRILHYLKTIPSGFPSGIEHIYMGHTHLPFSNFQWEDFMFHNSGSSIKGQESNILNFTVNEFSSKGL
jgi:UDP-2,3-diacylglucosamine pyrophosphatase LpxH